MANTKFFVVVATPHNGGHGPWAAPIVVTKNGPWAVEVARDVEKLGFRINWHKTNICVFRMEPEEAYDRAAFKAEFTNPLAYQRGLDIHDKFVEYFWDSELAKDCGMSLADGNYFNPSKPLSPEPSPEATI